MTNYNERLDDIFSKAKKVVTTNYPELSGWSAMAHIELTDEAKQAITSLIKELVVEAKPKITFSKPEGMPNTLAVDFAQRHLDEFEQNLLKALEEK